jgi:hypothetical protein
MASSTDEARFPSCSTGSQRRPFPARPGESIRCRSHAGTEWSRPSYEVSEMKRETFGCILQVRERKSPRSAARCPPRRVGARAPTLPHPSGWIPCETWPSCCGSLSRTTLRAHVPSARRCVGVPDQRRVIRPLCAARPRHPWALPGGAKQRPHSCGDVGRSPLRREARRFAPRACGERCRPSRLRNDQRR